MAHKPRKATQVFAPRASVPSCFDLDSTRVLLPETETIPKQGSWVLIIQQACLGSFSAASKPKFASNTNVGAFFKDPPLQSYMLKKFAEVKVM